MLNISTKTDGIKLQNTGAFLRLSLAGCVFRLFTNFPVQAVHPFTSEKHASIFQPVFVSMTMDRTLNVFTYLESSPQCPSLCSVDWFIILEYASTQFQLKIKKPSTLNLKSLFSIHKLTCKFKNYFYNSFICLCLSHYCYCNFIPSILVIIFSNIHSFVALKMTIEVSKHVFVTCLFSHLHKVSIFEKKQLVQGIFPSSKNPSSSCFNLSVPLYSTFSGKLLLMLQSVKRSHSIDANNPELHVCLVRFALKGKLIYIKVFMTLKLRKSITLQYFQYVQACLAHLVRSVPSNPRFPVRSPALPRFDCLPNFLSTWVNSAFHPSGVGKWVPASAGS